MWVLDQELRDRIARVVESEGMELVHVEFKSGKKSALRLLIDKPSGINHQDCKVISDQVSVLLDVEDPIPGHYVLEVSSPGLDRPLFSEADFRRFIGRRAKIRTREEVAGRRSFKGRIAAAAGGVISVMELDRTFEIPIAGIEKANLEIEW